MSGGSLLRRAVLCCRSKAKEGILGAQRLLLLLVLLLLMLLLSLLLCLRAPDYQEVKLLLAIF